MFRTLMFRSLVCVGLLAVSTATAQASILGDLLSFDGTEDIVTDDSVGIFADRAGDADLLQEGDLIQGMINFDPIDGNGVPAGTSVIGAYSFEVDTISDNGFGGKTVTFIAASGADSVGTILAGAGVDLNGLSFAGAGLAVLESSTAEVAGNGEFAGPPFGFTGASGIAASDFSAVLSASVLEHVVVSNADITDLSAPLPSGVGIFIEFFGTYDIVDHDFGGGTVFLDVTNVNTGTVGDIKIDRGFILSTNATTSANGWDYNDDGDYIINAVPEPSSMAIFAGLGILGLAARFRRRRKKS